jgi:hypothetical protein
MSKYRSTFVSEASLTKADEEIPTLSWVLNRRSRSEARYVQKDEYPAVRAACLWPRRTADAR